MGPRFLVRTAGLEMHPIDQADRTGYLKDDGGIGFCNITKCCTEVCPEHIKITDNAIIPMKERVVDRRYDPVTWLGRKIFRRDQLDDPQTARPVPVPLSTAGSPVTDADVAANAGEHAEISTGWHSAGPTPIGPALAADGKLDVAELLLDRSGAASPFGDDQTFPLPPERLNYQHPSDPEMGD